MFGLVSGGDNPWKTKAEEDVDAVGTGNVSYSGIGILGVLSGSDGGKGIWKGGTHSNEGDSSD